MRRESRYTPDWHAYIKAPPGKPTGRLQTAHLDATYVLAEDVIAYERLTYGTEEGDEPDFYEQPEHWAET